MTTNVIGQTLLDANAIKQVAPVSDVSIWRWVKEGKFPAPVKVGRRSFWRASEIEAWVNGLHPRADAVRPIAKASA